MRESAALSASFRPAWRLRAGRRVLLLLELAKARLCLMVLVTTAVGYLLAAPAPLNVAGLFVTLVGTALAAFGANALNQCLEVDRDARMTRTCGRPLPSGRLSTASAHTFAVTVAVAGPLVLAVGVNPLAGTLALLTEAIYLLAYTPLKPLTSLNTLVGAVVGAIPPMIGWSAAAGRLDEGAWLLAAILFLWQIPHFLALAWMYRDDYSRGGFRMLSTIDKDGRLTASVAVAYAAALVPVGMMTTLRLGGGAASTALATLVGVGFVALCVRFWRRRDRAAARRVFFASVLYLPLMLGLLAAQRGFDAPRPSAGAPLLAAVDFDHAQP